MMNVTQRRAAMHALLAAFPAEQQRWDALTPEQQRAALYEIDTMFMRLVREARTGVSGDR